MMLAVDSFVDISLLLRFCPYRETLELAALHDDDGIYLKICSQS
jgi:hypothetical protein